MVDNLPKRPYIVPEVEQPPLAPDLEWMLSSSQASEALIAETLIREYYAFLVQLLHCLLGDQRAAKRAVTGVVLYALAHRREYKGKSVKAWLSSLVVEHWRRQRTYGFSSSESPDPSWGISPLTSEHSSQSLDKGTWKVLNDLPWEFRLLLALYYVHGFSEPEMARILNWREDKVRSYLERARQSLRQSGSGEEGLEGLLDDEAWIVGALQKRWPSPQPSPDEIELAVASLQGQLEQRRRLGRRLKIVWQLLLALAMLVFMVFIGWLTNQYVVSETSPRTVVVTVVVTRQVRRQGRPPIQDMEGTPRIRMTELGPIITPVPPLFKRQPLKPDSSEAEIRLRMIESRGLWHTARVEALIVQSGPPGYIGSPRIYRNLIWVSHDLPDEVERRLVLSGELVGDPLYAFLTQEGTVYEVDVMSGLSYTYPSSAPDSPFYSLTTPEYLSAFGVGPRGILNGTYLFRLLFPASLASEYGGLRWLGWDQILGREVLVVDKVWHGVTKSRLWVDAQTGIVLRWKRMDRNDPMMDIESITITSLDLEVPFLDERWLRRGLNILPYDARVMGWHYMPSSPVLPDILSVDQQALMEPISPPEGFDPSRSRLFFQWRPSRPAQVALPGDIAEIFTSEGFLLGRVPMGNPWDLYCERSPDGRLIAYAHPSQGWRTEIFLSDGIFWFSLDQVSEVHHVLPNAVAIGSDFAFSPDGRFLAFWGCGGNTQNCGVYIHDTSTQKNTKLMTTSISEEVIFLTWSPDGAYLAMVKEEPGGDSSILTVVQVSSARVVYEAPFPWRADQLALPRDSPVRDWGVPFPPPRPGLEGCVEPPSQ